MDDILIAKLVLAEHDELRDVTGEEQGKVPTYTPVAFTSTGQVD